MFSTVHCCVRSKTRWIGSDPFLTNLLEYGRSGLTHGRKRREPTTGEEEASTADVEIRGFTKPAENFEFVKPKMIERGMVQTSGRDSQDLRFFTLVFTSSRFRRQMHVACSVTHERPSLQQMAKWRNLSTLLSTVAFTLFCHACPWLSMKICSFCLSGPRVCLPDVSCLFGLTLRPSAPVCRCHRDSLTRGRVAFE